MEYFTLNVLGLTRELPILETPKGIKIAGFNPVGDMKLLESAGKDLARQIKESGVGCEIILTTELKGLPIAQEVARELGVDYVALRKELKCYMANARQTAGESITSGKTNYFISEIDENKLVGKKVAFVDDVFSTGSTFKSMLSYAEKAGFTLTCSATILKEDSKDNIGKIKSGFIYNGVPNYFSGYLPLQ